MSRTARNILSSFLNRIQFNSFSSPLRTPISHLNPMRCINSLNQTIALTIPVLANFLQLKKTDPFSTHPRTMRLAVSTTVIFYLAYTALLRFPLRRRPAMIADHCLLSIGNAAVASLASLLLPDHLGPFVFAGFGLLSAAELMYWLYRELVTEDDDDDDDDEEFDARRMRVSAFFDNIWTAFSNITARPHPILPL